MKAKFLIFLLSCFITLTALAQFAGPSITGNNHTVSQINNVRLGTYVTLTGHIVSHQRGDYFTFRDDTGEIRVEIELPVWQNQQVTPETKVQLFGEVDTNNTGRYLWIKTLQIIN